GTGPYVLVAKRVRVLVWVYCLGIDRRIRRRHEVDLEVSGQLAVVGVQFSGWRSQSAESELKIEGRTCRRVWSLGEFRIAARSNKVRVRISFDASGDMVHCVAGSANGRLRTTKLHVIRIAGCVVRVIDTAEMELASCK